MTAAQYVWPWMDVAEGYSSVLKSSQLKGLAARRQVLADTLKCCVVTDFIPTDDNEDGLYEFIHELDSQRGSTCVVSSRSNDLENGMPISTRRDSQEGYVCGAIDLSFGAYCDAYSTEEALVSVYEEGERVRVVSRTLPWFDEFVESIEIRSVASFDRVAKIVQNRFIQLKDFYTRIAYLSAQVSFQYAAKLSDHLAVLHANFPRGILGYRCQLNCKNLSLLKSILIKQTHANGHHPQLLFRKGAVLEPETLDATLEETNTAVICKEATIPDLKHAWGLDCRIGYIDRNRPIPNMAHAEAEAANLQTVWTLVECRSFLEKLAIYGKNFKRISLSLSEKTERDCVEFYYRFKVHLDFKAVINAGSASRQDRRKGATDDNNNNNSSSSLTVSYKQLIDEILKNLPEKNLNNRVLQDLNISKMHTCATSGPKTYIDDLPTTEVHTRNSLIEIIAELIARGYPVPEQMGIVEYVTPPKTSLSVVKTEISVLDAPTKILQQHHTI